MHELDITHAILDRAIEKAVAEHAMRITDLFLIVGELSNYADEVVKSYWSEISRGTIAEGANLHIRHIDAELQCMACFTKYHPKGAEILCPSCGSGGAKILAGEEFYMEAISVE